MKPGDLISCSDCPVWSKGPPDEQGVLYTYMGRFSCEHSLVLAVHNVVLLGNKRTAFMFTAPHAVLGWSWLHLNASLKTLDENGA